MARPALTPELLSRIATPHFAPSPVRFHAGDVALMKRAAAEYRRALAWHSEGKISTYGNIRDLPACFATSMGLSQEDVRAWAAAKTSRGRGGDFASEILIEFVALVSVVWRQAGGTGRGFHDNKDNEKRDWGGPLIELLDKLIRNAGVTHAPSRHTLKLKIEATDQGKHARPD